MKFSHLVLWVVLTLSISGCSSLYVLHPVSIIENAPAEKLKYAVITPTTPISSASAGLYGGDYIFYGASTTKTVTPGDVIKGNLIKRGIVILPSVDENLKSETVIVSYGESGRRSLGLGYTIEVTIQFVSAENSSLVCSCTAEGMGETEVDDVRIAINRCLDGLFLPKYPQY